MSLMTDYCVSENSQDHNSMDESTSFSSNENDDDCQPTQFVKNLLENSKVIKYYDYESENSQEGDSYFLSYWTNQKNDIEDDRFSTTAFKAHDDIVDSEKESDSLYVNNYFNYRNIDEDDNSSTKAFDDE
jgi:hypothetical protein